MHNHTVNIKTEILDRMYYNIRKYTRSDSDTSLGMNDILSQQPVTNCARSSIFYKINTKINSLYVILKLVEQKFLSLFLQQILTLSHYLKHIVLMSKTNWC